MIRHFIIEGRYMGEGRVAPALQEPYGVVWGVFSLLYYCCSCGEVFARSPVYEDGVLQVWQPVYALCRKPQCSTALTGGIGKLVPGSVWHHNPSVTQAMPKEVLLWEAARNLDQLEKELK